MSEAAAPAHSRPFAFVVHPRDGRDIARRCRLARALPEAAWSWASAHLRLPVLPWGEITYGPGGAHLGLLVLVRGREMLSLDHRHPAAQHHPRPGQGPARRPGVDGGLVAVPDVRFGIDIGLPPGDVFACLAETVLLALDGHDQHVALGIPTLEQVRHVAGLARRHRDLGVGLAPFHSFSRPIDGDRLRVTAA